jgi:hypothetical protein
VKLFFMFSMGCNEKKAAMDKKAQHSNKKQLDKIIFHHCDSPWRIIW